MLIKHLLNLHQCLRIKLGPIHNWAHSQLGPTICIGPNCVWAQVYVLGPYTIGPNAYTWAHTQLGPIQHWAQLCMGPTVCIGPIHNWAQCTYFGPYTIGPNTFISIQLLTCPRRPFQGQKKIRDSFPRTGGPSDSACTSRPRNHWRRNA